MIGAINLRTYIIIALGTAGVCYLIGLVGGDAIGRQLDNIRFSASASGLSPQIASVIIEPIKAVLSGEIVFALIGGALWPLAFLWLFLLVLSIVFSVLSGGAGQMRGVVS